MKAILFFLIFSGYMLYGSCSINLEGRILDIGSSEGIDSVKVVNNKAYVSLNFEFTNLDEPIFGFGEIDVSNPYNFTTYNANKKSEYDYNATKYLGDISNFIKLYIYGKDFTFFGDNLGQFPHFELSKVVQNGDKIDLYGYTSTQNSVYIWKITVLNNKIDAVVYKKYDNFFISSSSSDTNGDYFLLLANDNNSQKIYNIIFASYGDNYIASLKSINTDALTTSISTYPLPSIISNSKYLFVYVNSKVLQIDKSTYQVEDIVKKFQDNPIGMFLYATCSYIFYSSDFDKLVIQNLDTNEFSKIQVWDPSKGVLINDIFLLANMGAMVNIINVSDPMHPYIESNTTQWGHTDEVVYENGKMYVGYGWGGLAVYDVSGCIVDTSGNINKCPDDTNGSSDISNCCFTYQDLELLPSGWSLVGTGCDINDTSVFHNIKMVWQYNSKIKRWEAYSPDNTKMDLIKSDTYLDELKTVGSKKGFWILK